MAKRILTGVVTKDKLQKTRRVEVTRLVKHPKYGKFLHRRLVCAVHDEGNESRIGDTVEIIESRPHSKTKRWELHRVLKASSDTDVAAIKAAAAEEPEVNPSQTPAEEPATS